MKKTIIALATAPFLILSAYAGDVVDFGAKTEVPSEVTAAQLKEDTGFVIAEVREGSAAATLGLKKNDIVTAVNGKTIRNIVSLSEYIAATCDDGAEVGLTWSSGGEIKTGKVIVTEKTAREDFIARYQEVKQANVQSAIDIQTMISGLDGGSLSSVVMNMTGSVSSTVGDHKFTGTKVDGDKTKKHIKITKKDTGEVAFEGDVNPSDLSNVPEALREDTKTFLNLMNMTSGIEDGIIHGASFTIPEITPKKEETPEKDIDDLVEDIDKDTEKKDDKAPKPATSE